MLYDYADNSNSFFFRAPIVHLDVSTPNIVLDAQWNARLIDFGLARELTDISRNEVLKNNYFGTKQYRPEGNIENVCEELDYYSFGIGR